MHVHELEGRARLVVFDPGDEVVNGLQRVAAEQHVHAARFTAIGAFSSVRLGYFDPERKDYRTHAWDEQVEACSIIGNISLFEGKPKVHAHAVIGTADGRAWGGHLLEARVWPTFEVFLDVFCAPLNRIRDPETGLALFDVPMRPPGK